MDKTFRTVAASCGLRLSYYITAALLAITFLVLIPTLYRTVTPLYILLCLAVLPSITKAMFFSDTKNKKREHDMAYPLFCKKYRYTFITYQSMKISHLLLFVLFAAWHISYASQTDAPAFIQSLPLLLGSSSLLIRIFATVGYWLYFRLFPIRAMR